MQDLEKQLEELKSQMDGLKNQAPSNKLSMVVLLERLTDEPDGDLHKLVNHRTPPPLRCPTDPVV